jgi:hypothetical protein
VRAERRATAPHSPDAGGTPDAARELGFDAPSGRKSKTRSSLQSAMENDPEKFPNGTYRKPREGRTTLIFLARKPHAKATPRRNQKLTPS